MKRDFKGIWIPKEIWEDDNLSASEKIIISEIDSFDGGDGCWAGNAHFSRLIRKSDGHTKNTISGLVSNGIIISKYTADGKRILSVSQKNYHKQENGNKNITDASQKNDALIVSTNTETNTTTSKPVSSDTIESQEFGTVEEPSKDVFEPKEPKKTNWEDCKTDLQRFIAFYAKNYYPTLYDNAEPAQVTSFFRTYGKMFSEMLSLAGALDVACNAIVFFDRHFKSKGWAWNLKTLKTNFPEFVNYAMEKKKEQI